MVDESNTILLVDGNALLHRGYHALPNLTNQDGVPTGAVFGFTRLLLAALKVLRPHYVAVTFDSRGKTFRHVLYKEYKANRIKGPDDLYAQLPLVKELVESLNIPIFVVPGFEADDLIGTLAKQANISQLHATILTGDMDLLQLVSDNVSVFAPQKGISDPQVYTPITVEHKYNFPPKKVVFFKSLCGDSSDNIPGVPGVGKVTAQKIVSRFDNLDTLYKYLDEGGQLEGIGPSIHSKLRDNKELAYKSFELATIQTDIPITLKKTDCVTQEYDRNKVVDILVRLGFRSLLKDLPPNGDGPPPSDGLLFTSVPEPDPLPINHLDEKLKPILRNMEEKGVKVDCEHLKNLAHRWKREADDIRQEIYSLTGEEFNVDSSRQLAEVLFEKLKLPKTGIKKIASGLSTDATQLDKLKDAHPVIKKILAYRELTKLINTYALPLPTLADNHDRIHTTYEPNTVTGRLSSKNPNLQNIPIRSEKGREIRDAFIANPGCLLVSADYSQIELRVAAHLSKDPVMIAAFRANKDIHDETSRRMNVDRRVAKVINFSILYGKGPHGFAQDLKIDIKEAKQYIDNYFKTYRGLNSWIEETLRSVSRNGYAQTMFGHRRLFPSLKGMDPSRYSRLAREAINLPVQGTAAEILKRAMIALGDDQDLCERMILTVHDELIFEIEKEKVETMIPVIKSIMERTTTLDVPLIVDIGAGPSWGSIKK